MGIARLAVTQVASSLLLLLLLNGAAGAFGEPDATPVPTPITFAGRVELVPGLPCNRCAIVLLGVPLGAHTDQGTRNFLIRNIPPGTWDIRVTVDDPTGISPVVRHAGGPGGSTIDLGVIVVSSPGAVSGRLINATADQLATGLIAVPEQGIFTRPDGMGNYLLQGVAPGQRAVAFLQPNQPSTHTVTVAPRQATVGVNFEFLRISPGLQQGGVPPALAK